MELNANWHLSCYKRCTHAEKLCRLETNFMKYQEDNDERSEEASSSTGRTSRSSSIRLQPTKCLFCDKPKTRRYPLSTVETHDAGKKLYEAVMLGTNDMWKVKLSGCIDPADAHAYDVSYHVQCYTKNVLNVLRNHSKTSLEANRVESTASSASKMEFINSLTEALLEGKVVSMAEVEAKYKEICDLNGVKDEDIMKRRDLKLFIEDELWDMDIEFSNPIRKNQPQRICLKISRDIALSKAEENASRAECSKMEVIFKAAKILRKSILSSKKWEFQGSIDHHAMEDIVPTELQFFFQWCIGGTSDVSVRKACKKEVGERATILCQSLMYQTLSDRQVINDKPRNFKHTHTLPLQVAAGLSIHSSTRSKFLVNLMHNFGSSIEYGRVLRLETAIAYEVLQHMEQNGGIYIPRELVKGRFMFCAADNLDFLEDTPDGKGTLHATVMICYQESFPEDYTPPIRFSGSSTHRSLNKLPEFITDLIPYQGPQRLKPKSFLYDEQVVQSSVITPSKFIQKDLAWLLCKRDVWTQRSLNVDTGHTMELHDSDDPTMDGYVNQSNFIPTWSAFNSALEAQPQRLTRVCMLPIIPASPTDHSVQLTFLNKLEQISKFTCGNNFKCILTLDMGLYRPVQQLIMSRNELQGRWILRPGELHILFAAVRAIGSLIDNTGITELWTALYSESTINQLLAGKNFRRTVEAHTRTLVALENCYLQVFFENNKDIENTLFQKVRDLQNELHSGNLHKCMEELCSTMETLNVSELIEQFDVLESEKNPTFGMLRQYMKMVNWVMLLIRSVRTGNWNLHLAAVEQFVKYFFALDLTNYSGLLALYLAEMKSVKESDPEVWEQFERGNWVVKKSQVPFCALAADEALEHENRKLKVLGGLVGITQRPHALARFFLTTPELQRITEQTSRMARMTPSTENTNHHRMSFATSNAQDNAISKLNDELSRTGNPFKHEGSDLLNIVTKAVFPKEIAVDVKRMEALGRELYESFKSERLIKGTINLWDVNKRNKLKLCSSARRKSKVVLAGTVTELIADRSLFARLLVIARSQRDIDFREIIGQYELSVVPRSMFAADGTMHQCHLKSKLVHILQSLKTYDTASTRTDSTSLTVAIVDAMAEVQAFEKTTSIQTCKDLADAFTAKMDKKYCSYNEVHFVFDTYTQLSIKNPTRNKRNQQLTQIQYKISDKTNISNVPMKKLLSHISTKSELTEYLSLNLLQHAKQCNKKLVVAWHNKAAASHCSVECLSSTQEEADTKMILHAINAKGRGATELFLFAQDTDVLVVCLKHYHEFPPHSFIVSAKRETISLKEIYQSLGPLKAAALTGFHALSGCDSTGSLVGKGKLTYWKAFSSATEDMLLALKDLGSGVAVSDTTISQLEAFICRVYQLKNNIDRLEDLRWWFFKKKQTYGEHLPPTKGAFIPAVKRANYQALVWSQASTAQPNLPSPIGNGWIMENGQIVPVLCDVPCAPETIMHMVKCSCVKSRCSGSCKCASFGIPCTEMCECGGDYNLCQNVPLNTVVGVEDDFTDEEDFEENDEELCLS